MQAHLRFALTILSLGISNWALPCSGPPAPQVPEAFKSANAVFLAQVKSTIRKPTKDDKTGKYITETVTLSVLEVWKGALKSGDTVTLVSDIGPGPCGLSTLNEPEWLEDASGRHLTFSGIWLIHGYGSEPYQLSMTTRSRPLEFGGVLDLPMLYDIVRRPSPTIHP
jgi:hypothetical protein